LRSKAPGITHVQVAAQVMPTTRAAHLSSKPHPLDTQSAFAPALPPKFDFGCGICFGGRLY